jgi:hypothetical protein
MIITLILVSALLAVGAGYLGYRAYILAGWLADAQETIEGLDALNIHMYSSIQEAYELMKTIDGKGAFEADDEAGTTFQMLKQVINELNTEFNGEASEEIE